MAMIETSIKQGIEAQELLGPMLRWKQRFATETRTTVTIRAYRRVPSGLVRFGARRHLLRRSGPCIGLADVPWTGRAVNAGLRPPNQAARLTPPGAPGHGTGIPGFFENGCRGGSN